MSRRAASLDTIGRKFLLCLGRRSSGGLVGSRRTQNQHFSPSPLPSRFHDTHRNTPSEDSTAGKRTHYRRFGEYNKEVRGGVRGLCGVDGEGDACPYLTHTLRVQSGLCSHFFPLLVPNLLVHRVQELPQPRARLLDPEATNLPPRRPARRRDSREGTRAARQRRGGASQTKGKRSDEQEHGRFR